MTKNFVKKTKIWAFSHFRVVGFVPGKNPASTHCCSQAAPVECPFLSHLTRPSYEIFHILYLWCVSSPELHPDFHHKIGSNSILSVCFLTSSVPCLKGSPVFCSNIEETIEWFGVESTSKGYLVPSPHPWVVSDQQQTPEFHLLPSRALVAVWQLLFPCLALSSVGKGYHTLASAQLCSRARKCCSWPRGMRSSLCIQRLNMLLY